MDLAHAHMQIKYKRIKTSQFLLVSVIIASRIAVTDLRLPYTSS